MVVAVATQQGINMRLTYCRNTRLCCLVVSNITAIQHSCEGPSLRNQLPKDFQLAELGAIAFKTLCVLSDGAVYVLQ